jgi:hypothetical protein
MFGEKTTLIAMGQSKIRPLSKDLGKKDLSQSCLSLDPAAGIDPPEKLKQSLLKCYCIDIY